jgi:hypothetical protein
VGSIPIARSTSLTEASLLYQPIYSLELKLTQPFDKALVLDLVVPVLKFHHEFFLLQTTERIFRCI